jgi:hypothetical protein
MLEYGTAPSLIPGPDMVEAGCFKGPVDMKIQMGAIGRWNTDVEKIDREKYRKIQTFIYFERIVSCKRLASTVVFA